MAGFNKINGLDQGLPTAYPDIWLTDITVVLTEMDTHFTVPLEEPSEIQDPTTGELEVLRALKSD